MRGSVRKRCQCRDADGRRVKACRKNHGSWFFALDAGNDPATGKRQQISRSGFRTRDEADEAMTKELAALDAGTWTDDHGISVEDWLNQWIKEMEDRGLSPKTLANYRGHSRDVWAPQLGHLRLRDLRRGHVERVLADLNRPLDGDRPEGNVGRRVQQRSASTVAAYRRTIRAALSVAQRRGLIAVNPAQGRMDSLPPRADDEAELTMWQPQQTARFLGSVRTDRLVALYELAAYAGLRRAELCGLRWADLDDDGAGLTVRQTIVEVTRSQVRPGQILCPVCGREHVGRLFKRPKSKAGRRWVPLAGPPRAALESHRLAQNEERAMFGPDYDEHDLVFCEVDGKPMRPGAVTTAFEEHVRACGLPVVRLHDTRHGACSLLLAGGVPIEVVQMILGHASPDVTRRVYAHVMRHAAAEQVEAATQLLTIHRL
jgi:integrase